MAKGEVPGSTESADPGSVSKGGGSAPVDPVRDLDFLANFLKVRVLMLLLFVAIISALLAGGGVVSIGYVVVSGTMAVVGSTLLNQYMERDVDAKMERTRDRPLPLGVASPKTMLVASLALIAGGVGLAATKNLQFAVFVLGGAFIYIIVYTAVLKRRTWMNIVIGGSAGSCAILAGWTAAAPLDLLPLLLSVYLFLWTPTHFWALAIARKDDYARAGIPMLPVVVGDEKTVRYITINSVSTVLFSLIMWKLVSLGGLYLLSAVLFGSVLLAIHLPLLRNPHSQERAWRLFKVSNLYLAAVFLAVLVDTSL